MSLDKTPSERYLAFAEDFVRANPDVSPGSMFGMRCLKRQGKAFAGGFAGGLVVTLASNDHARTSALEHAHEFDPSGAGRPMKAWVVVGVEHEDLWQEFAALAYASVLPPP